MLMPSLVRSRKNCRQARRRRRDVRWRGVHTTAARPCCTAGCPSYVRQEHQAAPVRKVCHASDLYPWRAGRQTKKLELARRVPEVGPGSHSAVSRS